jgi:hypothetical protein
VIGDPSGVLPGDHGTFRLVSNGDRTTSPLVIFDFGQDVGGKVQVKVTGTSGVPPGLHASFSESRLYQALQPGDNNGETTFAPGSDTANIWVGFPVFPYSTTPIAIPCP